MKDSIKIMQIYRTYLENTGKLIEILEGHCKNVDDNLLSETLKNKYKEYRQHIQKLISNLNDDLHILLSIDYEVKELEAIEKKEK